MGRKKIENYDIIHEVIFDWELFGSIGKWYQSMICYGYIHVRSHVFLGWFSSVMICNACSCLY